MRQRRITNVGLVLVLALGAMSFKCNATDPDGTPAPLRDASRAADAIAGSIKEMTTVKRELARQGKITPAEELKLTQTLLRLNTADKAFVTRLKSLRAMPDATGKAQLLAMFNEVTAALDDLNTNGVLGISNEEARNRLTTIITAIRSSVAIIQAFVQ